MRQSRDRHAVNEAALKLHPDSNLDLLEEELLRQRDSMRQKISNSYTRASVLVGSAGILSGVGVGFSTTTGAGYALLVSIAFYGAASVLGVLALRPMSGDEVDVESAVRQGSVLSNVELKRAIILSNLTSHFDYEASLRTRTRIIVTGFSLLIVAFLLSTGASTLRLMYPPADSPIKVVIEEGKP